MRHPLAPIPTVNFHLVRSCNMRCGFCFARFDDVHRETGVGQLGLPFAQAAEVITALADFGFRKITFAGGEPTLRPDLPELIRHAKSAGLITAVVTNGSRLDADWIARTAPDLDQLALSIDSARPATRIAMGRAVGGTRPLENTALLAHADLLRAHGVKLKLNSVITTLNAAECMTDFVRALRPARWKIFQALRIAGQNDADFARYACADLAYAGFVARHQDDLAHAGIPLVPEDNTAMTASYAMVDPFGRFFDNHDGRLRYSAPILLAGAAHAFASVRLDVDRFAARGGHAGLLAAA